ncbi:atp-binding cassette sub-family b [Holotrichia oblita]|uniref:Atp-binding cassette sub-family b n=1 Tax=Holotrichia oblita TaxID=644536 RepID=A0ACB9TKZ7_HOLOL|nr:atp-binding cassette sub-family b [Holotrichia oblita]
MMRILQCSSNINSFLRYSSRTFKQTIKCDHQTFAKSPSKPFTSTPSFTEKKVVLGALAVALLNIQIPQIMGSGINVITRFSQTKDGELFMEEMKIPALKLLGMYLAQVVCLNDLLHIYVISYGGERIAYEMRKDLFSAIAQQDIAFFDIQRTGEIINRLTADIQDFKSSFKQTVSGGLRAATQIIGCSVSLVLISPQMTLFTLLCVPSVIVVGTIFRAVLRKTSRRAQAQIEKTTAVADEAVANIRDSQFFPIEIAARSCIRYGRSGKELFDTEAELSMEMVLSTLYMGGYLLSTDQLSAGDMMAFLMATQTIQRSLAQISLLFGAVMRGSTAGARVFEYINLKPVVPLRGGTIIPYHSLNVNLKTYEIEFKNVNFAYPSRPEHIVLKNFNLKVPPGKTIAIVGASGNGKSTVVALIERFYDVNDGVITIDGTDIRNLDPTWLRQRALGLISQEPILFGTTVMENIRYGKPEIF